MSPEENRAIARRYIEQVWNKGDLDQFEEFIAADAIPHSSPAIKNRDDMKNGLVMIRNAFPDLSFTIEDDIAADDKVIQRWTISGTHRGEMLGVAATGKQAVWSGISILRLAGGKIAEYWVQNDTLGLMQQLGAMPAPGG